jgi:hypothetical protein
VNKIQNLRDLIEGRAADLASIRRQREKASDSLDVALRRNLREQESDAVDDINEYTAQIAKIEAWEKSSERIEELAKVSREAAAAEEKFAEANALWRSFIEHLRRLKEVGEKLSLAHGGVDQHARGALDAKFSQDMTRRMEQIAMIMPFSRANNAPIAHAVAGAMREVLMAVPGGKLAAEQYLIPSAWTNWADASIESAVTSTHRDFTARMRDITRTEQQ